MSWGLLYITHYEFLAKLKSSYFVVITQFLYYASTNYPSILISCTMPTNKKQPLSIMLPLSCLTVDMVFFLDVGLAILDSYHMV